jgi:hypothetical protein
LLCGFCSLRRYASAYWEDEALLNSLDFALDADKDAKYASFVEAPVKYVD